ncbi:MAG: anaerobic ribonucleoside-triphosphate reductase [[Clostridium] leptum]
MKEAGIGYGSVNHPVDRDPVCGYTGIIGDECPHCRHETPDQPIERIRRITGYLVGSLDHFNNAKRRGARPRQAQSLKSHHKIGVRRPLLETLAFFCHERHQDCANFSAQLHPNVQLLPQTGYG